MQLMASKEKKIFAVYKNAKITQRQLKKILQIVSKIYKNKNLYFNPFNPIQFEHFSIPSILGL